VFKKAKMPSAFMNEYDPRFSVVNKETLKGGSKNYFASRFSAFFIGDENF